MRRISNIALILFALVLLAGCADQVSFEQAAGLKQAGFFSGLWHGLIIVIAWLSSLFFDDVAVYAIYNNGGWYDFGFVLGVGGMSFSSGFFSRGSTDSKD